MTVTVSLIVLTRNADVTLSRGVIVKKYHIKAGAGMQRIV
jgi:hypothetical protein